MRVAVVGSDVRMLSLHHLTALDASPVALVDIAARLQCAHVSLFTWVPPHAAERFPLVRAADRPVLQAALRDSGVSVCNLEVFPLTADTRVADYTPALALGADLGARRATVHLHVADEAQAQDLLGEFCRLAHAHALHVGLEFTSFSVIRSFADARAVVRASQADNLGIAFDPLHFMRNGGDATELTSDALRNVNYAQFCDGPLQAPADRYLEAVTERGVPGSGVFPLRALASALPRDVVIDIEVPQDDARLSGVSALDRARRAVDGTRDVLASISST